MEINLDYLNNLYEFFIINNGDKLKELEIESFDDFKDYIKRIIIDNIYYDFYGNYNINEIELF